MFPAARFDVPLLSCVIHRFLTVVVFLLASRCEQINGYFHDFGHMHIDNVNGSGNCTPGIPVLVNSRL
jgi:hypothetical protein